MTFINNEALIKRAQNLSVVKELADEAWDSSRRYFNPITNHTDAFDVMVALYIVITYGDDTVTATQESDGETVTVSIDDHGSTNAAARMAITMLAANLAKDL